MANLVDFVNNELSTKKDFPAFGAGDTITVYYEIKEGEKTRTQFFKGVVTKEVKLEELVSTTLENLPVKKLKSKKEEDNSIFQLIKKVPIVSGLFLWTISTP